MPNQLTEKICQVIEGSRLVDKRLVDRGPEAVGGGEAGFRRCPDIGNDGAHGDSEVGAAGLRRGHSRICMDCAVIVSP